MAASATFALKVAVWFRRGRLFMVSPDSLGTACPLSGRNSTYRSVQISETSSEIYHLREAEKIPQVMSPDEMRRLLAVANSLKTRVLLSLGYGCGLRAGEIVRLKAKHIDSAQKIIRIEQSKGRKDRN